MSGALPAIQSNIQPVQHHDKDACFDDFHGILVIDMPTVQEKNEDVVECLPVDPATRL